MYKLSSCTSWATNVYLCTRLILPNARAQLGSATNWPGLLHRPSSHFTILHLYHISTFLVAPSKDLLTVWFRNSTVCEYNVLLQPILRSSILQPILDYGLGFKLTLLVIRDFFFIFIYIFRSLITVLRACVWLMSKFHLFRKLIHCLLRMPWVL